MDVCPELCVYDFKELDEPLGMPAAILLTNLPSSSDQLKLYQKLFPNKNHKNQMKKIEKQLSAVLFGLREYARVEEEEEDESPVDSEEETAYDAEDEYDDYSIISSISGVTRSEWDFVNDDLPGDAPDVISLDGSVLEYADGLLQFKNI